MAAWCKSCEPVYDAVAKESSCSDCSAEIFRLNCNPLPLNSGLVGQGRIGVECRTDLSRRVGRETALQLLCSGDNSFPDFPPIEILFVFGRLNQLDLDHAAGRV